jgi:hypothetical protein
MRKYYATGKSVSERNKASKKMFKKANQKKSAFGMLSVKKGIDNDPNPTYADKIAGATMGKKRAAAMGGGMMRKTFKKGGSESQYHTTKDGRRVKKGLYYYMNRAKKRGTSKPGKGSVTDKALKQSAKTAKK